MPKAKQINIGERFSYLTIIKEVSSKNKKRRFIVECDCGVKKEVSLFNLLNGSTKSCGCKKAKKHNLSNTKLFRLWVDMRQRCYNKNNANYKNYGKKGIIVCDEWKNDFMPFYTWAYKNGYKEELLPNGFNKLTIDRIDPNGNYEPSNCRWVDMKVQATNKGILSTNTSGYVGVSWIKSLNKWGCVISINNKSFRIGSYKTQKEAVEARNDFIEKHNLPHKKNVYVGEKSYGKIG